MKVQIIPRETMILFNTPILVYIKKNIILLIMITPLNNYVFLALLLLFPPFKIGKSLRIKVVVNKNIRKKVLINEFIIDVLKS